MAEVRLSANADADLLEIGRQGRDRWGIEQAVAYLESFDEIFDLLARYPASGRRRDDVRPGLRSRLHESHIVYYVIEQGDVRIARVLHAAQNVDLIEFD